MFAAAERLELEGIVAKRKADPYTPGTVWYNVRDLCLRPGLLARLLMGACQDRSSRNSGFACSSGQEGSHLADYPLRV